MKRTMLLATICLILAGCNSEVTVTPELAKIPVKRVYIEEIVCADSTVSTILRDRLSQELIKEGVELAQPASATINISGTVFLTPKARSYATQYSAGSYSEIGISSVSLRGINRASNQLVFIAAYNCPAGELVSVHDVGTELGQGIAERLRR